MVVGFLDKAFGAVEGSLVRLASGGWRQCVADANVAVTGLGLGGFNTDGGNGLTASAKVKTLMTMMCDALLAHEDGVKAISDRARAMGASEEEISETIRVAFWMGGLPALVTGLNAFRED